jgi:hypothetical protein
MPAVTIFLVDPFCAIPTICAERAGQQLQRLCPPEWVASLFLGAVFVRPAIFCLIMLAFFALESNKFSKSNHGVSAGGFLHLPVRS